MFTLKRMAVMLFVIGLGVLEAAARTAPPTVHVIAVADTFASDIGAGSRQDMTVVRTFFARVLQAGIPVRITEVTGESFSCGGILQAVSNLTIARGDVIVFYYSGHGMRTANMPTKFPAFACNHSRGDETADLSDVVNRLKAKAPRLTIAIADTCNDISRRSPVKAPYSAILLPADVTKALKHLFLDYRGTVIMSAAIPGQFAWGENSGSYFTRQLFQQSIPRTILVNDGAVRPRWEAVIVDALRDIEVPADQRFQSPQVATTDLAELWPLPERLPPPRTNR